MKKIQAAVKALQSWIDSRVQLEPDRSAHYSLRRFLHLGSLVSFTVVVFSGLLLALHFNPSTDNARNEGGNEVAPYITNNRIVDVDGDTLYDANSWVLIEVKSDSGKVLIDYPSPDSGDYQQAYPGELPVPSIAWLSVEYGINRMVPFGYCTWLASIAW
jgi:quinol-cytochrome oxidoreductase complex cytochrome b subunit